MSGCHKRSATLSLRGAVAGMTVAPREQMIAIAVLTLPLYYWGAAGATIFWLIGATLTVVLAHATFIPVSDNVPLQQL